MAMIWNNQTMRMEYMPDYPSAYNQPKPQSSITWVQGEAGAKAYSIPISSTVLLMDSEAQKFYIKSTDSAGMPTLKVYEYTEQSPTVYVPDSNIGNFPTREEFDELKAKYDELFAMIPKKRNSADKEASKNE